MEDGQEMTAPPLAWRTCRLSPASRPTFFHLPDFALLKSRGSQREKKRRMFWTSWEAQWLTLHASNVWGMGSILGQGTRIPCTQSSPPPEKINRLLFAAVLGSTQSGAEGMGRSHASPPPSTSHTHQCDTLISSISTKVHNLHKQTLFFLYILWVLTNL